MEEKKYDYYILKMERCVELFLVGPISTEKEAQERLEEYQEDPSEIQNCHAIIKVTQGSEVDYLS